MRKVINFDKDWKFIQKDVGLPKQFPSDWEDVDLPHCWNSIDGHDGKGAYDRGSYWYAKEFETPKQPLCDGRTYVEVMAAGQQATIYVNGQKATYHEGGYSMFRADVTDYCYEDKPNLLVINCSNEYLDHVYPQKADFTFCGGLYRGVNLISVNKEHFDLDYYGTAGIKVTPIVKEDGADFEIESYLCNVDENFTVLYSILDKEGKEVAGGCRPFDNTKTTIFVPDAKLWDIDNRYMYKVVAKLQRRNETYDEVSVNVGVRSFNCDPDEGFFLNGEYKKLRGVSRHQDRLYKGYALSKEDHYEDAQIIKDLGANTIRLAHYQHSQHFYDACDKLGFIVWAEIPFISVFNENPKAHLNCLNQMRELVVQNYHHPSICFWGLSNEVEIGGEANQQLLDNHNELNDLCHKLDKTRLTTIANVSMTSFNSPLNKIPDVVSYNHYLGWYGGKIEDNGPTLDEFHKINPEICSGLSEYGCEGILTYHTENPVCKDYTEEYQALYHEKLAKVLDDRKYLWSTHVWNMFDFGVCARDEGGVKGRNNKGLVTMDRKTYKDAYFVYKAYWTKDPMVHICGRRYVQRENTDIKVKVYSNQKKVSLYLNNQLVDTKGSEADNPKVFIFDVKLNAGENYLFAKVDGATDSITLENVDKEPAIYTLPEFQERQEGVTNWFEKVDEDLSAPMAYPPGRYNINDRIDELIENPEAREIAIMAVKFTMNMNIDPDDPSSMYINFKDRQLKNVLKQGKSLVPEGFTESVNAKLIKIKK